MKSYVLYIAFAFLVVSGLAAMILVRSGYYPVAIVNGHWISEKEFESYYGAASTYYENLINLYRENASAGTSTLLSINQNLKPETIQAAALSAVIENYLVADEAKNELGNNLNSLVEARISQVLGNVQLEQATQKIYGFDFNEFEATILKPQAERDILTARFSGNGQNFVNWLVEAKKSARVVILVSGFSWDGQEVIRR